MVEGGLGYRGLIVSASGSARDALAYQGLPTLFRVRNGNDLNIDAEAEAWLLGSAAPAEVPADVEAEVEQEMATSIHLKPEIAAACSLYLTSTTNFSFWNGATTHRTNNNCYNYCSNYRTNTFAQPGRGSGQQAPHPPTVSGIKSAALRDGYGYSCSGTSLYVALCI